MVVNVLLRVHCRRFGLTDNEKPSSFASVLKIFVQSTTAVEASMRLIFFWLRPRIYGNLADGGLLLIYSSTG